MNRTETVCTSIQGLLGRCHAGFDTEFFLLGVEKMMCVEPFFVTFFWLEHCSPRDNLHALRLFLGLQKGWKLATDELLSIKTNINLQNSWGGGGGRETLAGEIPTFYYCSILHTPAVV